MKEAHFNPSQVVTTLVLTTENIRDGDLQSDISETVKQQESGFHILSKGLLKNVSYAEPPYLVGDCTPMTNLALTPSES